MFINPRTALEKGWLTPPKYLTEAKLELSFIQPNAVDFTIDRVFSSYDDFLIKEDEKKVMRKTVEEFPKPTFRDVDGDKYWHVYPQTYYDINSDFYVNIPEGVLALLFIRSTFNRNGIFLTSGIYDSGFKGSISCSIHNKASTCAYIAPNTRIGQIAFAYSDSAKAYEGNYNTGMGQHWTEMNSQRAERAGLNFH